MFDDTLSSSWEIRSRRGLTTLTSVALQVAAVTALLVAPLLRPPSLPSVRQLSMPISWGQPLQPVWARISSGGHSATPSTVAQIIFATPSRIPKNSHPTNNDDALPQTGVGLGVTGAGTRNGIEMTNLFASASRATMPAARPEVHVAPIRISHMSEGNLIRKVQPAYPALARSARIQGTVVLQAVISRDGMIENLRLLTGHPMLAPAAIQAVKQWRYRPYILNNEPLEVETEITVNFSLAGN